MFDKPCGSNNEILGSADDAIDSRSVESCTACIAYDQAVLEIACGSPLLSLVSEHEENAEMSGA